MSKDEFINELREALTGEMDATDVEKNIRFYYEYIDSEVKKGKLEEEVLRNLGDPRLIAKTLLETYHMQKGTFFNKENRYDTNYEDSFSEKTNNNMSIKGKIKIYGRVAIILIIFILIFLLASVALVQLIKIAIPIIAVVLIFNILKKHL